MFRIPNLSFLLFGVIVVVGIFLARRGGGTGLRLPTLVLKKFSIDENATDGVLVYIEGRAVGIIAWLLNLLKFDATTSFTVTEKDIKVRSSSLFGQFHHVAPLSKIADTGCGYAKPLSGPIIGAVIFFFTLIMGGYGNSGFIAFIGFVIFVITVIIYIFTKKLIIRYISNGGFLTELSFRRSVIENVSIEMEQGLQVIQLINSKLVES